MTPGAARLGPQARDGRFEVRHQLLEGGEQRADEALGTADLGIQDALALGDGVEGDAESEGGDADGGVDDDDEFEELGEAPFLRVGGSGGVRGVWSRVCAAWEECGAGRDAAGLASGWCARQMRSM